MLALATACSRGDTVQAPQTSEAPTPAPAAAPATTVPPTAAPAPDFVAVSKLMNDAVAAQKLPGAVVLIGHGGRVVFHQAYGSRKLAGEQGLDGSPAPAEPMT
ncbi:MAG TPA: serine hydrolase, partial [Mycobacterium sp.]|nr:serine hydrolase [Mycobacterium sp.]